MELGVGGDRLCRGGDNCDDGGDSLGGERVCWVGVAPNEEQLVPIDVPDVFTCRDNLSRCHKKAASIF